MDNYFKVPFANAGDKTTIPDDTQANGSVSYTTGYGLDYQKQRGVDTDAKAIERDKMNALLFKTTAAIQAMQTFGGASAFITAADNGGTAYSYSKGARVSLSGVVYESLTNSNTTTPPGASWQIVNWSDVVAFMDTRFVNATGDFNLTGEYRTTGQFAAGVLRASNTGIEVFNGLPGNAGSDRRWKIINVTASSDALRIEGDYAQKGLTLSQTGDLDVQGYVHAGSSISTPGLVSAGGPVRSAQSLRVAPASGETNEWLIVPQEPASGTHYLAIKHRVSAADCFVAFDDGQIQTPAYGVLFDRIGESIRLGSKRILCGEIAGGDIPPNGFVDAAVTFPISFSSDNVYVVACVTGSNAALMDWWQLAFGRYGVTFRAYEPSGITYAQSFTWRWIAIGDV